MPSPREAKSSSASPSAVTLTVDRGVAVHLRLARSWILRLLGAASMTTRSRIACRSLREYASSLMPPTHQPQARLGPKSIAGRPGGIPAGSTTDPTGVRGCRARCRHRTSQSFLPRGLPAPSWPLGPHPETAESGPPNQTRAGPGQPKLGPAKEGQATTGPHRKGAETGKHKWGSAL